MLDYVKIAEDAIRSMRKESTSTSGKSSIYWKGLSMTPEEARAVIRALERQKARYIKRYRNTETSAKITEIAFDGTGEVLDATTKGLKTNPFTMLAGLVLGGIGNNVEELGGTIADGIGDINLQQNASRIAELESCIGLLEKLIRENT